MTRLKMREISEEEANRLGGEIIPPVICKVENETTESAVCLKKLPHYYLLGIGCETKDCLQLFLFEDEANALEAYGKHAAHMKLTGLPFLA